MKLVTTRSLIALLSISISLESLAETTKVKEVAEKPVIPLQQIGPARTVSLTKLKANITTPPANIGPLRYGWGCRDKFNIGWDSVTYAQYNKDDVKIFREELAKANYPVIKAKEETIFEDESAKDVSKSGMQLHVGAYIKEVQVDYCSKNAEITRNEKGASKATVKGLYGAVYVKVFWQAYLPEGKKVVFETTTEGGYRTDQEINVAPPVFFQKAFAMAIRNLMAEKGFQDAIFAKEVEASTLKPIKMRQGKLLQDVPLKKNITNLRLAVATIVRNDKRSGSGFIISQEGYWITNHHVVGDSKFIKVKLSTGRELVGEVVRIDPSRDVALIKTEPITLQTFRISRSDLNIGDDVYVLGSPLGDTFNSTLTRGILSGYRTLKDKRFIQSDVSLLPGNSGGPLLDERGAVNGISVQRLKMGGMSFFIPIKEAIADLGIVLVE
jgi:serine protease Do